MSTSLHFGERAPPGPAGPLEPPFLGGHTHYKRGELTLSASLQCLHVVINDWSRDAGVAAKNPQRALSISNCTALLLRPGVFLKGIQGEVAVFLPWLSSYLRVSTKSTVIWADNNVFLWLCSPGQPVLLKLHDFG